jgi:heme A synthase
VSATSGYRLVSRLGLATTLMMYGLMVIGSVVRSTGSGLSCPDWPLCGGHLVPPAEPHVLIEWLHRLVALLVSLMLVATAAAVLRQRETRARLGGLVALAFALLGVQIVLGALTVWKLLSPAVVGSHLGVALFLFCTLLALTLTARAGAPGTPRVAPPLARSGGGPGAPAMAALAVAAFGQCLLGGIVSATGAGAACRDWPFCGGVLFPALQGLVGIQLLHRYGAYALVTLALLTALRARRSADARVHRGALAVLGLVLLEAFLGVGNLVMGTPPWLTALHLAAAIALLATALTATLALAPLAAPVPTLAPAEAR